MQTYRGQQLHRTLPPAFRKPKRRIIAAITILATVLGLMAGSAIPARADDDLAKALAAIAVIGIIAHAANAKDKRQPPAIQPPPQPATSRRVPAACGLTISGTQTRTTLYAENCMLDRGLRNLPTWCARPAEIYGRPDFIYTADCLRDGGFRPPRGS